jgi:hypothetical protein
LRTATKACVGHVLEGLLHGLLVAEDRRLFQGFLLPHASPQAAGSEDGLGQAGDEIPKAGGT